MSNSLIIFSLNGCSHCKTLKNKLTEISIPYMDIEITKNESIWNEVVNQTGYNILPTVYIRKDDGDEGPVFVPGRDFKNDDEIIEIIKRYIKISEED